jgi:hypothetical protein
LENSNIISKRPIIDIFIVLLDTPWSVAVLGLEPLTRDGEANVPPLCYCHGPINETFCKKRVVVQNKSNLFLKIIF